MIPVTSSRQLYRLFIGFLFSWTLASLYFYSRFDVDMSFDTIIRNMLYSSKLSDHHLKLLMSPDSQTDHVHNPLDEIILQNEQMFQFFNLPKRKMLTQYTEITTANRDTGYPLAPDFTFHGKYGRNWVQIYEDHGPGCISRIYVLPLLPTDTSKLHKMTSKDLKKHILEFNIDGQSFRYTLQQISEGNDWPFLYPVSTRHARPASGLGTYTPLCYQKSMVIIYHTASQLPDFLLEKTIDCSLNDLLCPVHIYSAVSRHKFPQTTTVDSFVDMKDLTNEREHKQHLEMASKFLSRPEELGPAAGDPCLMECVSVCAGCRQLFYVSNKPQVIKAIYIRVFDSFTGIAADNWDDLFITIVFDDAEIAQVDKVSLGTLFAASGSKNTFRGATVGRTNKLCTYEDSTTALDTNTLTGYLYFPMPFWSKAALYLHGHENMEKNRLVCAQVSTVPNYYVKKDTAYFHARHTYFTDNVSGWRSLLNVKESWGHIVGLFINVDNLKAVRDVALNARWAALQADILAFIDGHQAASVMGTGLEDYFSYAHGFALAENTSYSFVGVPHAGPRRSEPLTWHCYRLHVLDPITFQSSIQYVMEGTGEYFLHETRSIPQNIYRKRLLAGDATISHLVLYYSQPNMNGMHLVDTLNLADPKSEKGHSFYLIHRAVEESGEKFEFEGVRYVGDVINNVSKSIKGRTFASDDIIQFTYKGDFTQTKGLVLRQEIISNDWNYRAKVTVNNLFVGTMYIPMTSLTSSKYSLLETDLTIDAINLQRSRELVVEIEIKTPSHGVSYKLLTIV